MSLDRRAILTAAGAALILPAIAKAAPARPERLWPAQTSWTPPPPQAPAKEGLLDVGGAKIWYWDTGGPGEAVVFLHPNTGSGAVWGYQQPVLVKAGYRVIAYSRRGYFKSETGPVEQAGTGAGDLHQLMAHLRVRRFHLVGSAAGGFIVPDYCLSYPGELISAVMASTLGGVQGPQADRNREAMQPEPFGKLPAYAREVGPSYRFGYPEGLAEWILLEHAAAVPGPRARQGSINKVTLESIEAIRTPMLIMTGDADMLQPPSSMRAFASHLPHAEIAVIAEAGHAAYWEQPRAFNAMLLDFLRRHPDTPRGRRRA